MPERSAILLLLAVMFACGARPGVAAEILRDPTRPYNVSAPVAVSKPRFKVNAIFVSTERRVAIVNGHRVGIGGQVDGATVIAIAKDQLTLEFEGARITAGLIDGGSGE